MQMNSVLCVVLFLVSYQSGCVHLYLLTSASFTDLSKSGPTAIATAHFSKTMAPKYLGGVIKGEILLTK